MEASQVLIRPGRASDLDAMYALDCECFAAPFRFSRRTMASFARAPNARTFVAESVEGEMVGFLIVELQQEGAYLITLDVHPGYRRQGIAGDLLSHAEHWATAGGVNCLFLHVADQNLQAIRFYEKAGYESVGRVPDYYGQGLAALIYSRNIAQS